MNIFSLATLVLVLSCGSKPQYFFEKDKHGNKAKKEWQSYTDQDGDKRHFIIDSLGNKNVRPLILEKGTIVYPKVLQKKGLEGFVLVEFKIKENGSIKSLTIVKGDEPFYSAALSAAKGYKFKSALKNGQPYEVEWKIPFRFRLRNKSFKKKHKMQRIN